MWVIMDMTIQVKQDQAIQVSLEQAISWLMLLVVHMNTIFLDAQLVARLQNMLQDHREL